MTIAMLLSQESTWKDHFSLLKKKVHKKQAIFAHRISICSDVFPRHAITKSASLRLHRNFSGADAFIREFHSQLTISLGHSTASYEIAQNAFAAGASHVTHLFNAMPPLHHRNPGIIGAATDCPHAMAEIICDGIHIHPSVIRNTFRYVWRRPHDIDQ